MKEYLDRIEHALTIPAAEYVPAIGDVFVIIDEARKALDQSALQQHPEPVAKPSRVGEDGWRKLAESQAALLALQEVPREPVADFDQEYVHAYLQEALTDTVGGAVDPEVQRFMTWLATSPSTTRQQEVGSGSRALDVIEDMAQDWDGCEYDGASIGLVDIGDWIRRVGFQRMNAALAAAPSTPENADGGPHG